MKTLYLEKRGCDFFKNDNDVVKSNVGNYRVGSYNHSVVGTDGNEYIMEFSKGIKNHIRTENLRTGKPLKKAVVTRINNCCLCFDTEYVGMDGMSRRNLKMEETVRNMNLDYTLENILKVVNMFSVDKYDTIEFID